MTFLATGNELEAVVDAVVPALKGDSALMALLTGVYGHVPQAQRTSHPYVRVSDPLLSDDFGAMGVGGGRVQFAIDVWSNAKGPHAVRVILARLRKVLERRDLVVVGFKLAGGSLHCTESRDFTEPDPDMPEQLLYHGHQAWEALVDEA